MEDVWSHKTPSMPKFLIVGPMIKSKKISADDKQDYSFGVDMLLYLVKHSCPDLAHAYRELLKVNDGANPAAYKELLCMIKYILDVKNLGLEIKPMRIPTNPGRLFVLAIAITWETH